MGFWQDFKSIPPSILLSSIDYGSSDDLMCGSASVWSVWNHSDQNFYPCFQDIVLPSALLLYVLCASLALIVKLRSYWPQTNSHYSATDKVYIFLCLCSCWIFSLFLLGVTIIDTHSDVKTREKISFCIMAATMCVFIIMEHTAIMKRLSNSALRLFWVFLQLFVFVKLQDILRRRMTGLKLTAWDLCLLFAVFVLEAAATSTLLFRSPQVNERDFSLLSLEEPLIDHSLMPHYLPASLRSKQLPELSANFFEILTFWWITPLLKKGSKRALEPTDLYDIDPREKSRVLFLKAKAGWNLELSTRPHGKRSLIRVFVKLFWKTAGVAACFKIFYDILLFAGPLVLKRIVTFLALVQDEGYTSPLWMGYAYALFLLWANTIQTFVLHQYFHRQFRIGMRLRSILVTLIYDKALRVAPITVEKKNGAPAADSTGEIVNLMAVDSQRIQDVCTYIQLIWSSPFQIIIALVLLYNNIGVTAFAGVFISFLSIPFAAWLAKLTSKSQKEVMSLRDERMRVLNEALSGVRIIKMYGWEASFTAKIQEIRMKELSWLWKYRMYQIAGRLQWLMVPVIISLTCFALYTFLGNTLDSATAFSTLALVNVLRFPMQLLPMMVTSLIEASISINRIVEYIGRPELPPSPMKRTRGVAKSADSLVCKYDSVVLDWPGGERLLQNLSFECHKGELTVIIGSIGSGKSGLISSMLGDVPASSGSINIWGSIAYVAQMAWIQNATLRDNILFGKPYDPVFYHSVVEACCLEDDFKVLPNGDLTEIGEKGVNISGGQKQRVSIARAVYHNADLNIFDDCFSAIDAEVSRVIFEKVFLGLLKGKTNILVTHQMDILHYASKIIFLKDKGVYFMGDYWALKDLDEFKKFSAKEETEDEAEVEKEEESLSVWTEISDVAPKKCESRSLVIPSTEASSYGRQHTGMFRKQSTVLSTASLDTPIRHSGANNVDDAIELVLSQTADRLAESERKEVKPDIAVDEAEKHRGALIVVEDVAKGRVSLKTYVVYLKACSFLGIFLLLLSQIATNSSQIAVNTWLSLWSDAAHSISNNTGLSVYTLLTVAQAAVAFAAYYAMAWISQRASIIFHNNLVKGIFRAPVSFFDTTPLGRVMNRFSKDAYTLDEELPQTLMSYITLLFSVGSVLMVIAFIFPYFLVVAMGLISLYYIIQRFYIPSARQLQRLDSVLRSPIFANFSETLSGVSSIRAFSKEDKLRGVNETQLDSNLRAYYLKIASNRWLAVRLEFVGTFVVFSTALFSVMFSSTLAPGWGGLALSYSLTITQSMNFIVRLASNLESSIVSVERVVEYSSEIESESSVLENGEAVSPHWPQHGEIEFRDIKLRYRPGLPLVLNGLSMKFKPGERIGIVGRTGAGKSSIMNALLRLNELASGSILIDKVNTSSISLQLLRTKICIVPQDPVLFSGTLRFNVDPFDSYSDAQIWQALGRSHLTAMISGLGESPLEYRVEEGGKNFSMGERQLICLARAILRNSKIILLDEATSVVDPQTDALIQDTIGSAFKGCTILTIAHRINTTLSSDRIVVMDQGKVKEFDTPKALFSKQNGIFRKLCNQSGIYRLDD